jgi:hypothetical protein
LDLEKKRKQLDKQVFIEEKNKLQSIKIQKNQEKLMGPVKKRTGRLDMTRSNPADEIEMKV